MSPNKEVGEVCPEILVAVLTRYTEKIANPQTKEYITPEKTGEFGDLFRKCEQMYATQENSGYSSRFLNRKLNRENREKYNLLKSLLDMVNEELNGEKLWSPWAKRTYPRFQHGEQSTLDTLVNSAKETFNITMTEIGIESMTKEQCCMFINNVFSRTSDLIVNPIHPEGDLLNITERYEMVKAMYRVRSLLSTTDSRFSRFAEILSEELFNDKAWSAYKKTKAPPNTAFGLFSEIAGLIDKVETHLGCTPIRYHYNFEIANVRSAIKDYSSFVSLYKNEKFQRLPLKIQYELEKELEEEFRKRHNYFPAKDDSRTQRSRTRLSSASSKRKSPSKGPEFKQQPIQELCRKKFSTLVIPDSDTPKGKHHPIKRFVNKLKKVCNKVVDKKECNLVSLSQRIKELAPKCNNNIKQTTIHAINGQELETLLAFWYQAQHETRPEFMSDKHILHKNIRKRTADGDPVLVVAYDGQAGIDAGGLRIHFFQQVIKQLFARDNNRFLIETETEPHSNIYMFNTTYVGSADDIIKPYELFRFFGEFTAFMIINGFKYPGHLTHSILANLLYKDFYENPELDLDDYALFYMLDYPETANMFVTTMQYPDDIESVGWEFNNTEEKKVLDRKIAEGSEANTVTAKTYRKYVGLLGRHHFINSQKGLLILEAFQKGFFIGRRYMRNHGYTISILDAMITGSEITDSAIDEIVDSVRRYTTVSTEKEEKEEEKDTELVNWFCNILKGTVALPRERWTREGNAEDVLPKDHHKEFMPALLEWWTGNSNFYDGYSYKLLLKYYTRTASNKPVPLPVAHTCFQSIDVSRGIESQDDLFYRFIKAIVSSGKEFHIG